MHPIIYTLFSFLLLNCTSTPKAPTSSVRLVVLGVTQDGGAPHAGCQKDCCSTLFKDPSKFHRVVSLGLIDDINKKKYLFEATPDIASQLYNLHNQSDFSTQHQPDGVFLTHAHMGHYVGLLHLGREVMSTDRVPVYVMPKFREFLEQNGPWNQLVALNNVTLNTLTANQKLSITTQLSITPIEVPHREEFSETIGFLIEGPKKSALFIPDIDKWEYWEQDINQWLKKVDYALLDATFYDAAEVNHRDISEIPHPFAIESMERFSTLSEYDKAKIIFIHLNHTNPLLNTESNAYKNTIKTGFQVGRDGMILDL